MRKLFIISMLAAVLLGCSEKLSDSYKGENWNDPVIPVTMVGIETVNIDNSGELPMMMTILDSSVKKEAYMVGIKWVTENKPNEDDDKFITGTIREGEHVYGELGNRYSKAIKSNTQFNVSIDSGKYVSKFFKEIDRKYLPDDVNEGFVLLVAPDPGTHSFRVEYYEGDSLKFFHDTKPIKFY